MLSQANSFGLTGLNGFPVKVEVYISGGLHAYETVGLPDAAVKESVTFVPVETLEEAIDVPVLHVHVKEVVREVDGRAGEIRALQQTVQRAARAIGRENVRQ